MQSVIRRTVMAERQAARRLAKRKQQAAKQWQKDAREQGGFARRDETDRIKAARLERREDYELGPLAPKRDVGNSKDTYGTISQIRMRGQLIPQDQREKVLESVGGRYLNIVAGDRVVLLEGPDKGQIGKISNLDALRGQCTVDGLNMVDVAIPKYLFTDENPDRRPVRSVEKPVPLTSVRLVFPLTDYETGETKDVIVKKLINGPIWHDRHSGATRWSRIIPGLNIRVPWPKKDPKERKEFAGDTLRLDVETKTFVPTLLTPPMPGSVIDELRNKYSKFRTRHDPEYIEAKMNEDVEKEEKKKLAKEMRTPLQEANRLERKLKRAKGKGKLTPEMLERIGQLIANKRQPALDLAGMSAEPTTVAA